jgi:hypothetical protein
MNPPDSLSELRDLCDRLLDGDFTVADRERIEALVLGDAALRRAYVEFMHLHATLRQNAPLAEVMRSLPVEAPVQAAAFRRWPLGLAAALAIGFAAWWFARPEPLATIAEARGARWENSSLPTAPGSKLHAGRLHLSEGIAKIVFRSGAEVSLEGPAELELTGPNTCFLHGGALVAHVPESARGFAVGMANARLIDHGTDFGMSTDATGRAQVQVLNGEVELQHGRSGESLRLLTRESARVTPERLASTDKPEGEPDRYAFARSATASRAQSLTLTTASGDGDAAYVVSPNSTLHFSDTLLLVKNAPSKSYRRKAYLRFDLTPLRDRRVTDATLTLNFEATGFGYASLTGECTFAVLGVTDDAQDAWSADTLTWENAPAFSPDAGAADPASVAKLGTFTLGRGVVSGAFSIEGRDLADFLNRDANRRATLIVVRETSEKNENGAVHGFSGNHHPTLAPPTLRLTLSP